MKGMLMANRVHVRVWVGGGDTLRKASKPDDNIEITSYRKRGRRTTGREDKTYKKRVVRGWVCKTLTLFKGRI